MTRPCTVRPLGRSGWCFSIEGSFECFLGETRSSSETRRARQLSLRSQIHLRSIQTPSVAMASKGQCFPTPTGTFSPALLRRIAETQEPQLQSRLCCCLLECLRRCGSASRSAGCCSDARRTCHPAKRRLQEQTKPREPLHPCCEFVACPLEEEWSLGHSRPR